MPFLKEKNLDKEEKSEGGEKLMIDIGKILDIIKDPDLKIKISSLYGENLKLKEQNYVLQKKLDKFKEDADITSKLVHEDNHYFIVEGEKKDGPFCTKCWDADNKLIRLHKGGYYDGIQYFECPNCKTEANTGTFIPKNRVEDIGRW